MAGDAPGKSAKKRTVRTRVIRLAALLVCLYPVYVLVGLFGGRVFIYPGASFLNLLPDPTAAPPEVLTINTDAGKSTAWFYPPTAPGPAPLVVFFHGNGELVSYRVSLAGRYRAEGFAVLMPEYRGYHGSDGPPHQEGIVSDVLAFIDEVSARDAVNGDLVVLHGFSLGGGIAGATAAEREPRALVLSSTFTSMGSMFQRYLLPPVVAPDQYPTKRAVESLGCPVLVTHGTLDTIVPTAEGRQLGRVEGVSYHEYESAHMDALQKPEAWARIMPFVRQAVSQPGPDG